MKLQLLFVFLFTSSVSLFSQEKTEDEIFTFLDDEAQFPGGWSEMLKFLNENTKYPESALIAGIQGRVTLRFIVEKDGSIQHVTVVRGVPNCPECDEEAVRVLKAMPNWIPGKNEGKPVRSYFNIPFTFKFDEPEKKETKE